MGYFQQLLISPDSSLSGIGGSSEIAAKWFYAQSVSGSDVLDDLHSGTTRPIQPGRHAQFDGTDDYLVRDTLSWSPAYPFTMGCWAKADPLPPSGRYTFLSLVELPRSDVYFAITTNASGELVIKRRDAPGQGLDTDVTNNLGTGGDARKLVAGQWHCVYVVLENATTVRIYLDGTESLGKTDATAVNVPADMTDLLIGVLRQNSATWYHDGGLFDARIYSRALSASEIASIYNTTKEIDQRPENALYAADLVGHWMLDHPQPQATPGSGLEPDRSGNGNHTALTNVSSAWRREGNDVPISWQNEAGFSVVDNAVDFDLVSNSASLTAATSSWKSLTWTASGTTPPAVAITSKYLGQSSVPKVTFTSAATGGASVAKATMVGEALTVSSSKSYLLYVKWAPSRPMISNESITFYVVGQPGTAINYNDPHEVGKWNYCSRVYIPVTGSPELGVYSAGILSDIDVYVEDMRLIELPTSHDEDFYPGFAQQDSSIPGRDILGAVMQYKGQAPRNAKLVQSHCLSLDGVNEYVSCGTSLENPTGALSYALWCKIEPGQSGSTAGIIGRWNNSGAAVGGSMIWMPATDGLIRLYGGAVGNYEEFSVPYTHGEWFHLAATYDGDSTARMYFNGLECESLAIGGSGVLDATTGSAFAFMLGCFNDNDGPLEGSLADCRVYNQELTQADIDDLIAGREPTSGKTPIGHWPCAEGAETTIYDISGNDYHGTVQNGEANDWTNTQDVVHRNITRGYRVDRATGSGRSYDANLGGTEYQYHESSDAVFQPGTDDFWIAGEVTLDVVAGAQHIMGIYDLNANRSWLIYRLNTDLFIGRSTDGSNLDTVSTTIAEGVRAFIFAYYEPAGGKGIAVDDEAFATDSNTGEPYASAANFTIGTSFNTAPTLTSKLKGDIHWLAFGRLAATPASWTAIRDAIYNSGSPLAYSALTSTQKTDWGVKAWWDMLDTKRNIYDQHDDGPYHLTGVNVPLIPAKHSGGAANGSATNNSAGAYHNGAETKIDFTGGVADAPWTRGLSLPTTYAYRDTLPATMAKRLITQPNGETREDNFSVLKQ